MALRSPELSLSSFKRQFKTHFQFLSHYSRRAAVKSFSPVKTSLFQQFLQLWVSCAVVRCCCDCTASSMPTTNVQTRLDSIWGIEKIIWDWSSTAIVLPTLKINDTLYWSILYNHLYSPSCSNMNNNNNNNNRKINYNHLINTTFFAKLSKTIHCKNYRNTNLKIWRRSVRKMLG